MPRKKNPNLTVQQERFIRMEANGMNGTEIIPVLFDLKPDDPGWHAAECTLSRWRKHPKYEEVWKDEIRRQSFPMMTKAIRKLNKQIDSDVDWLANKAANDIINFSQKKIFGNDENTVTVNIQGMPDIGSPDDDG